MQIAGNHCNIDHTVITDRLKGLILSKNLARGRFESHALRLSVAGSKRDLAEAGRFVYRMKSLPEKSKRQSQAVKIPREIQGTREEAMAATPQTALFARKSRTEALLKEAYWLTDELAEMDKKIEHDLNEQKSSLEKWIEDHVESTSVGKAAVEAFEEGADDKTDKAKEAALKQIFKGIFKLLGISASWAELPAKVASEVLSPERDSQMVGYFDQNPWTAEYDKKKKRLEDIYKELLVPGPPKLMNLNKNICDVDACWRSRVP
jgi:hypothetical protein